MNEKGIVYSLCNELDEAYLKKYAINLGFELKPVGIVNKRIDVIKYSGVKPRFNLEEIKKKQLIDKSKKGRKTDMPIKRTEVKKEDKWNVEAIFQDDSLWEKELDSLKNEIKKITYLKGKLKDSSGNIKKVIELDVSLSRRLDRLYTYSHLKNDEDTKNEKYKTYHDRAYNVCIEYSELSSWITPEILKIDDKIINKYINSEYLERLPVSSGKNPKGKKTYP